MTKAKTPKLGTRQNPLLIKNVSEAMDDPHHERTLEQIRFNPAHIQLRRSSWRIRWA